MSNENTPDLRAAAEQALEALEALWGDSMVRHMDNAPHAYVAQAQSAIAALRAALAQPAAQPVAAEEMIEVTLDYGNGDVRQAKWPLSKVCAFYGLSQEPPTY